MKLRFSKIKYKNFLSSGNDFIEIQLDKNPITLIYGFNGHGKCVRKDTKISCKIDDAEIRQKFTSGNRPNARVNCCVGDIVTFYNQYPEYRGHIEVETRFGYKIIEYAGITEKNADVWELSLNGGILLQCSKNHRVYTQDYGWKKILELQPNDLVLTKSGYVVIDYIKNLNIHEDLYDLQVAEVGEYYTNDIVSHNSTMIDALSFVLFGKAFRDINKPQLVNTITKQNCMVEIEFLIGSKKYKIVRGIKPNLFEIHCNGKLMDQSGTKDYQKDLEENILRFNSKVFRQIVVLGSKSFIPFMKLDTANRRSVIEDLLDINIFSAMVKVLKQRIVKTEDGINFAKLEIKNINEKIALQKNNIQQNSNQNKKKIDRNLKEIENGHHNINDHQKLITYTNLKIQNLIDKNGLRKKIEIEAQLNEFVKLQFQFDHNLEKLYNDISFLNENDVCSQCNQTIAEHFKKIKLVENTKKSKDLEVGKKKLTSQISQLSHKISEMTGVIKEIEGLQLEVITHQNTIINIQNWEKKLLQENVQLGQITFDEENNNSVLKSLEKDLKKFKKELELLSDLLPYHDVMSLMLKDSGIKAEIIKQYLPIINNYVNKYLTQLDFFTNINFDENFDPIILSRYRDDFSYGNFSEGEKLRIDLAILFTWRSIAKIKNSIDTNLLILDEIIDSSLDHAGIEDFFKLLKYFEGDNIFIISPTGEVQLDKFSYSLKFVKSGNFTEIEEI